MLTFSNKAAKELRERLARHLGDARAKRVACHTFHGFCLRLLRRFGAEASRCRVPPAGPLSSLEAYAAQGEDLFAKVAQFRAWLSCRAPDCRFDILVLRYETLNVSTQALFDFLED